jgi:hypothetical protein
LVSGTVVAPRPQLRVPSVSTSHRDWVSPVTRLLMRSVVVAALTTAMLAVLLLAPMLSCLPLVRSRSALNVELELGICTHDADAGDVPLEKYVR